MCFYEKHHVFVLPNPSSFVKLLDYTNTVAVNIDPMMLSGEIIWIAGSPIDPFH